jgi:hypothetical protein
MESLVTKFLLAMKIRFRIILILILMPVIIVGYTNPEFEKGIYKTVNLISQDSSISGWWIKVDTFNIAIVPPSSGVQFYRDGIIYLSNSKSEGRIPFNHVSFGKKSAFYGSIKNSAIQNPKIFSPIVQFNYPCEAITFSRDFNIMYYTKFSDKESTEMIYKAKYNSESENQGDWTFDEGPLNFCTEKSIYTHPALSIDGKLMVFASNCKGSIGGMDLFITQEKDGIWSDPINLGLDVNSPANELYPFLDSENNLFFSSDGIEGFGGYDIYLCKFKSNTWEKPINLSSTINTIYDDVAFTINRKNSKSGFYTVKQSVGKRSVHLRKIEMNRSIPDTLLTLSQYFTRPEISHMVILAMEPAAQATDNISETVKIKYSTDGGDDTIVYRVQFMTSFNPGTRTSLVIDGRNYKVREFLYSGAYRLCVGEFSSLTSAIELQNIFRKNDYPGASVVAFRNDKLTLDPDLLKHQHLLVTKEQEQQISTPKSVTFNPNNNLNDSKEPKVNKVNERGTNKVDEKAQKAESLNADVREEMVNEVIYRIQFLSSSKQKGSFMIPIAGKTYKTYEYQYSGAYRSTIGEFSNLSEAKEYMTLVRQSGYPQAFVVAFINNVRSTDIRLFK